MQNLLLIPKFAFFTIFLNLVFFSCKKETIEPIDTFSQKREQMVGEWTATRVKEEQKAGVTLNESATTFTMLFAEDGTGIRTDFLGTRNFEWVYQFSPEKVAIKYENSQILIQTTEIFNVTKNEIDRQIWGYSDFDVSDDIDRRNITLKMDRK